MIFGHFWPLIPPNPGLRIFMRKTKTSLFLFHCYTTLCQKSERSNARFSRKSVTDGRADERTDERTDGGELIGPISASGRGPKIKNTLSVSFLGKGQNHS